MMHRTSNPRALVTVLFAALALGGCAGTVEGRSGSGGSGGAGTTSTGAGAGTCDDTDLGPQWTDPSCGPNGVATMAGALSAIAIRDESNDRLEVDVSSDPAATCGDKYHFPGDCGPAWRVRLDLAPEEQTVGDHAIGPNAAFAYVDQQGPPQGDFCENLGHDLVGMLRIVELTETSFRASLCGTGEHDGTVTANLCCGACKGTGQACVTDEQCCALFCYEGTCQP